MTKLSMSARRLSYGKRHLLFDSIRGDIHYSKYRRIAVLDVQNVLLPYRNGGMAFMPHGSIVVPNHFLIRCYLRHAILMCEEHVPVRKHHGIADFALAGRIVISPNDPSASHDKDFAVV